MPIRRITIIINDEDYIRYKKLKAPFKNNALFFKYLLDTAEKEELHKGVKVIMSKE